MYLLQVLLRPPSNYDTSSLLLTLVPAEIMAAILMIVASRDCNAFLAFVLSSKAAWSLVAPVANDLLRSSCCGSWENARVACKELRSVLAAERFLSSGTVQDFDSSMSRLYQKLCLSTGFCGVVDDRFLESETLFWANDARPVVIKKRLATGSSAVFHALDIRSSALVDSLFEPLRVARSCTQNIVKDHLAEVIGFDADQVSLTPVRRSVVDGADMFVVAGHFTLFSVVRMDQWGVVEEHNHMATFQMEIKRHSLCALQTVSSSVSDVVTACIVGENVEFKWQCGQRGHTIHSLGSSVGGYFVSHSIFVVGYRFCEWGVRHVSVGAHIATFMCRMLSVDMVTGEVDVGACSTADIMLPNTDYFSGFQCMERSHPALVEAKPHYTNDGKIKFVLPFLLEHTETANVTPRERSRFKLFTSRKHILVSAEVASAVDIQVSTSTAPLECLTGEGALYDVAFTASGRFGAVTHTGGTTFFDFHGGLIARRTHHSRIQPVVSFGRDRFCIQTDDTVFVFEKIISKIKPV